MKQAVVISSGIGNALLLIPLIKALRKQGEVHCLDATPYFEAKELFTSLKPALFDGYQQIKTDVQLASSSIRNFRKYGVVYHDYFGSTRRLLTHSALISRQVVANRIPASTFGFVKKKLRFIAPIAGIHEAHQYLRYVDEGQKLNDTALRMESAVREFFPIQDPFITIQPLTANGNAPWKNWGMDHWEILIQQIQRSHPSLHIVVLGDNHEMSQITLSSNDKLHNLIGSTSLVQLISIMSQARLHLGGDSGIMHLAGCLGIPTVTIWGGSDPRLYGWQTLNPSLHKVIAHSMNCHPCSRWILPNRTRVVNPAHCPDFKCIRSITPEEVHTSILQQLPDV